MTDHLGDSVFARIARKELPAKIVYQDEDITAFHDIEPLAPVHILIVPNRVIPTLNDATLEDQQLLGKMMLVARQLACQHSISDTGYRVTMNVNSDGGQSVFHIHLHLMGGQKLGRMA